MKARGEELVQGFEPSGHPSVFSTTNQKKTTDDYFAVSPCSLCPRATGRRSGHATKLPLHAKTTATHALLG